MRADAWSAEAVRIRLWESNFRGLKLVLLEIERVAPSERFHDLIRRIRVLLFEMPRRQLLHFLQTAGNESGIRRVEVIL